MSANINRDCVGLLHFDDGVSEGFADDEGNKDGLDVGILEGLSDDDGPVEGFVESDGLDDEEVEQMVRDAEAHAADDQKFESLVTARNTADGMIHATRKTLEEVGDEATDEERSAIERAITDLEASIKDSDLEAIEANTQKLTEASQGLAQKMYAKQAEADQAGAADASEQGSGANDDAVDAEFEEVKDDK